MKKQILSMLIVLILAVPCLAEVEPDGMFSTDGTLWKGCGYGLFDGGIVCEEIGFYQGEVYTCGDFMGHGYECYASSDLIYIDSPLGSIVYYNYDWYVGDVEGWRDIGLYIMQPIGFGIYSHLRGKPPVLIPIVGGILFKIDDNWTPPEFE